MVDRDARRDALIEIIQDWRREPWSSNPDRDVEALADGILERWSHRA